MTLMSSIFGEAAPASATPTNPEGESPDLFGTETSVPVQAALQKKSASAKKGVKKATPASDKKLKNKDESSSNTDEGQSSATQPNQEDDTQTSSSVNNKKKTKEQLKEEEDRTVFVGNLPPDISRKSLAGIFKSCGNVISARLRSMAVAGVKLPPEQAGNQNVMRKVCANTGKFLTDTPKKSAQGYVVFESIESTKEALQMNNTTFQSHTIRVDHANPTVEPSRSVFVGNLPYGADEETLREHFSDQLSEVEDLNERDGVAISGVRLIRDKETQKCKGFGYVSLRDATLVPAALQLHGTTYMKRELRVMVCGKRFKGKRGDDSTGNKFGRRSFEGQRATGAAPARNRSSKRKSEEGVSSSGGSSGGKPRKRRARSEKKAINYGSKSGLSKRAATEQKVNKRVKKLEKRAAKGMGKKNN